MFYASVVWLGIWIRKQHTSRRGYEMDELRLECNLFQNIYNLFAVATSTSMHIGKERITRFVHGLIPNDVGVIHLKSEN